MPAPTRDNRVFATNSVLARLMGFWNLGGHGIAVCMDSRWRCRSQELDRAADGYLNLPFAVDSLNFFGRLHGAVPGEGLRFGTSYPRAWSCRMLEARFQEQAGDHAALAHRRRHATAVGVVTPALHALIIGVGQHGVHSRVAAPVHLRRS